MYLVGRQVPSSTPLESPGHVLHHAAPPPRKSSMASDDGVIGPSGGVLGDSQRAGSPSATSGISVPVVSTSAQALDARMAPDRGLCSLQSSILIASSPAFSSGIYRLLGNQKKTLNSR